MRGDAAGAEVLALEGVIIGGPDSPDHLERLVEQRGTLVVGHPERGELAFEIPDSDRQREPPTGQQVQAGAGFGHHEGIPVRQHHDVGHQTQGRRMCGGKGHRHERVQRIVTTGVEPALGRSRMIGEAEPVESGGFSRGGHRRNSAATHQIRMVRVGVHRIGDAVAHCGRPGQEGKPERMTPLHSAAPCRTLAAAW